MRDLIPLAVKTGVDVLGWLQPPDVGHVVLGAGEAGAPHVPRESLIAAAQAAREYGVYGRNL